MLKINKIVFDIYNIYGNNYYNSSNINSLLIYYIENECINDNIVKIKLKDKYKEILEKIKKRNGEYKRVEEEKEKNEIMFKQKMEEMEKKYEKEKKELEKKISQYICYIIKIYFKYKIYNNI